MTRWEREAYSRGRESFERGDNEQALDAFTRLLETRSEFADVHYMVGVLLDRNGELDGAAQSLHRAIRLNPSYAEALLALATLCERRGDFERSRELAEQAAQLSQRRGDLDATTRGKLANMQAAVADAYSDAGELREAVSAYRKALERCPDFHDIRYRLATTLQRAGLPHQAETEFKRVLRGNPDLLDASVQLGVTYYSLGRAADAVKVWEAVLQRDPARDDARMYLRLMGIRDI